MTATLSAPAAATTIPCGITTVLSPSGEHRTFRVRTQRPTAGFAPGARVVALLTGPDNTANYTAFGFVKPGPHGEYVAVWHRYRGAAGARSEYERLADVLARRTHYEGLGCTYLREARCSRCNRLLTTPESIERGIGPECAEMLA